MVRSNASNSKPAPTPWQGFGYAVATMNRNLGQNGTLYK